MEPVVLDVLMRTSPDKIKNPAEWPGGALDPQPTPGEEMQPRVQPGNSLMCHGFRPDGPNFTAVFYRGDGKTLSAFCRTTP
jgi:hypothetical protein